MDTAYVRELLKRIKTLEKSLQSLESHHRNCPIAIHESIPILSQPHRNESESTHNDEVESQGESDSTFKFVTYNPHASNSSPRKRKRSQWRKVATDFLDSIPEKTEWLARRNRLNIYTIDDRCSVLPTILGRSPNQNNNRPRFPEVAEPSPRNRLVAVTELSSRDGLVEDIEPSPRSSLAEPTVLPPRDGLADVTEAFPRDCTTEDPERFRNDVLINYAKSYANVTKKSEKTLEFAQLVHSFRELVFVSLCVVLEYYGIPEDDINQVMKICISNSEPKHLKRLRRGARLANRLVDELSRSGWGDLATEMLFISEHLRNSYTLAKTVRRTICFPVWPSRGQLIIYS